jgi:hypothetical protein
MTPAMIALLSERSMPATIGPVAHPRNLNGSDLGFLREALCAACPAMSYHPRSKKVGPKFRVDEETGCWNWVAARDTTGYARILIDGRLQPAHRIAYEIAVGPIPAGFQIDHLCRNKSCINPAHLEAVTPVQNMRRGAHVKLSLEIVLEMRRLRGEGATYAALGRQFGVTDRCASFACRGRGSWYQETGVAA